RLRDAAAVAAGELRVDVPGQRRRPPRDPRDAAALAGVPPASRVPRHQDAAAARDHGKCRARAPRRPVGDQHEPAPHRHRQHGRGALLRRSADRLPRRVGVLDESRHARHPLQRDRAPRAGPRRLQLHVPGVGRHLDRDRRRARRVDVHRRRRQRHARHGGRVRRLPRRRRRATGPTGVGISVVEPRVPAPLSERHAMTLTRRDFIKSAAAGMSVFFLPRGTTRIASASLTDPVLVALFQRGAADGLNIVVPKGDPTYYSIRPTIAVPAGTELALDGFYGLNQAFASLLPLYQSGTCAFIHASGSPNPSRSHFDCQDFMERAAPGNKTVTDGWLNRYLQVSGDPAVTTAITLADAKVKSMAGPARAIAFGSIAEFALTGNSVPERRAALESRYGSMSGLLGGAVNDAFAALDLVASVDTTTSVTYPGG